MIEMSNKNPYDLYDETYNNSSSYYYSKEEDKVYVFLTDDKFKHEDNSLVVLTDTFRCKLTVDNNTIDTLFSLVKERLRVLLNNGHIYSPRSYHYLIASELMREISKSLSRYSDQDILKQTKTIHALIEQVRENIEQPQAEFEKHSHILLDFAIGVEKEELKRYVHRELDTFENNLSDIVKQLGVNIAETTSLAISKVLSIPFLGSRKEDSYSLLEKSYKELVKNQFLSDQTTIVQYCNCFMVGKEVEVGTIKWIGGITTAHYFFKELYKTWGIKTKKKPKKVDWKTISKLLFDATSNGQVYWTNTQLRTAKKTKTHTIILDKIVFEMF